MNSAAVIAFIEHFAKKIKQPTVLFTDNAPIHHSSEFEQKKRGVKKLDLHIFYLPTYSPHLNPIEILWRKIKY
jgi:transposase